MIRRQPFFERLRVFLSRHFLIVVVALLSVICSAQVSKPLGNDDVRQMIAAGMSDDFIVAVIRSRPCEFDTSVDALIDLKNAKASETVIQAMLARSTAVSSPVQAPANQTPAPVTPPGNGVPETPPSGKQNATGPEQTVRLCSFRLDNGEAALETDVERLYEETLKALGSVKYGDKDELTLAKGKAIQANHLCACVSAHAMLGVRVGFQKKVFIKTRWEIQGPSGCKVKMDTEVTSDETYGTFPNPADPKLKPVFLELARQTADEFSGRLASAIRKSECPIMSACSAPTFTVEGVISNVADARARQVIFDDARLQVAVLGEGGRMPVTFDGRGRVGVAFPDLPNVAMPASGSFSIECPNLKRGTYFLVAEPSALPGQHIAFLLKNGQPLKIEIGKADVPHVIDVGAVTIPVQ